LPEQVVIDFTDAQWVRVVRALQLHGIDPVTTDAVASWFRDSIKNVVQSQESNTEYDTMRRTQAVDKAADSWA
jgi:hypothetical protein